MSSGVAGMTSLPAANLTDVKCLHAVLAGLSAERRLLVFAMDHKSMEEGGGLAPQNKYGY